MSIVFLNVTGSLGGAERVLLTLLAQLRLTRPSWRFIVIAGAEGPLVAAVRELGCEAHVIPLAAVLETLGDWGSRLPALLLGATRALPAAFAYRKLLARRLRGLEADLVQTNGLKMHVLGALACPRGTRLFWHVHDLVRNRAVMRRLLSWTSARPEVAVAISDSVAQDLKAVMREPEKVRVVWNAVPRQAICAKTGGGEVRIGLVATFARWKGQEVYLRALARLPSGLAWQGFLVGGAVYSRAASQYTEAELRAVAAGLGLSSRVTFTGFLPDPAPFLAGLDIVVHASTEPEPFGLVVAEAMALGRAVVTSSPALVTDDVDGLVHARGDDAALAGALERLTRDAALRDRLGAAARLTAERRFAPERMAREFVALYEGRP